MLARLAAKATRRENVAVEEGNIRGPSVSAVIMGTGSSLHEDGAMRE